MCVARAHTHTRALPMFNRRGWVQTISGAQAAGLQILGETTDYLRAANALDESNAQKPVVLVANYMRLGYFWIC